MTMRLRAGHQQGRRYCRAVPIGGDWARIRVHKRPLGVLEVFEVKRTHDPDPLSHNIPDYHLLLHDYAMRNYIEIYTISASLKDSRRKLD